MSRRYCTILFINIWCSAAFLVLSGTLSSAMAAGTVDAYIADKSIALPINVAVGSSTPDAVNGRVKSSTAGCLVGTIPCPKVSKVKIDCPQTPGPDDVCGAWFPGGTKVKLRVVTNGDAFTGWIHNGPSQTFDYKNVLKKSISYKADGSNFLAFFAPKGTKFDVNLNMINLGASIDGARITSIPAGIDCYGDGSGTCSASFTAGRTIKLKPRKNTGTELVFWDLGWPYFNCDKSTCSVPISHYLFGP